jgi:glyoxylase-like metal-dependent hydrolase (beta-lactamase superfamily II)
MLIKKYPSGPLEVNSYLVLDEAAKIGVIVDPGGVNQELIAFVNDNSYTIPFILLTHGHSDHIGGVIQYKEIFGSKVIAYIDEKSMLNNHKLNYSNEVYGKVIEIEADEYVEEDDEVIVGALTFKFIHTPGHTKGGMCILIDDVLFSGDTLFYQSIGRTDFPGSSFKDLKAGIHDKLFKLDKNTRVLPGHMSETTIGFEMENNPFL